MNAVCLDWFYLKIYVKPHLQNRILLDYVSPVLDHYISQETIKEWFFIRYSDRSEARELSTMKVGLGEDAILDPIDQGYHLRVRLRAVPVYLPTIQEALISSLKHACASGYCERWSESSYIPEIDRYGGAGGIEFAHEVFYLNSQDVIALLRFSSGNENTEAAMRLGDELLQSLGLDEEARACLYFRRFQWFASTYQLDATDHEHLAKLYSKKRLRLDEAFAPAASAKFSAYQIPYNCEKLEQIGMELSRLEASKRLAFPKSDILAALHHMHCNRVGHSSLKELSILYCMHRWLKDRELC